MQKKILKSFIVLFMILIVSFLYIKSIDAAEGVTLSGKCTELNMISCSYMVDDEFRDTNVVYTVKNDELQYFECYNADGKSSYACSSDLELGNFKGTNKTYECPTVLPHVVRTSNQAGIFYHVFPTSEAAQDSPLVAQKKVAMRLVSNQSCNTFSDTSVSSQYSCGIYSNISLYSKRIGSGFSYNGIYTHSKQQLTIKDLKLNENFLIKGKIDDNGCPEQVCYEYKSLSGKVTISDECYYKTSNVEDGEDFNDNDPEDDGTRLEWRHVSAVIGQSISLSGSDDLTCEEALGGTLNTIQMIFNIFRIGAVVLLVLLSTLDFVKAVTANDESALKKASTKLIKRGVITIVFFLLPSIVNLILTLTLISQGTCSIV